MAAALWTGAQAGFRICSMTGFLPPHYGYSAYAISVLPFLAPWAWVRWLAGAALLASGNRASWVGALAGALWRRPVLALVLGLLAVVGGYAWKPRPDNDSIRIKIWSAALHEAVKHPEGIGAGKFITAMDGYAVTKAHSDVMQLLVEHGFLAAGVFVLAILAGLCALPASPEKGALIALSVQSVIDNRLHHPACATLYVALWLVAAREHHLALRARERGAGVAKLVEPNPKG